MVSVTDKYIFTSILNRGLAQGIIPNKTQEARDWYRNTSRRITRATPERLMGENPTKLVGSIIPGSMYMFFYDAKTKDTLPYWDKFPVIFAIEPAPGGFYGINLHYMQPMLRAKVMDALYAITSDQKYDERTKIIASLKTLKAMSAINIIQPCIKRYLSSHVQGRYMLVDPQNWDQAIFLPTERFQKASTAKVWYDTRQGYYN
jgi:hypothetical protein